MSATETYWVDGDRVDKATYVAAERAAGFRNSLGQPDEPATSWWSGVGADGFHHSGHMGWLRDSPLDLSGLGIPQPNRRERPMSADADGLFEGRDLTAYWVWVRSGTPNLPEDWQPPVGDGVTDDAPAIQALIDASRRSEPKPRPGRRRWWRRRRR